MQGTVATYVFTKKKPEKNQVCQSGFDLLWLKLWDKKWNVKKTIAVKEAILLHDYSSCSGLIGTFCSFRQRTLYFGTRQSIWISFFLTGNVKFPACFCTRRSENGSWNIRKKYPLIIKCVCIRQMGYLLTEFTRFASFPMSSSSRVLQDTEQGVNSIVLWWLL